MEVKERISVTREGVLDSLMEYINSVNDVRVYSAAGQEEIRKDPRQPFYVDTLRKLMKWAYGYKIEELNDDKLFFGKLEEVFKDEKLGLSFSDKKEDLERGRPNVFYKKGLETKFPFCNNDD
jgi:hypothetical protein